MKLLHLYESREALRLWHGTSLDKIKSILIHGLDTSKKRFYKYTEDPKVFFALKPEEVQVSNKDEYAIVEVLVSKSYHKLGPAWTDAQHKIADISYGYGDEPATPGDERIKLHDKEAKAARSKYGLAPKQFQMMGVPEVFISKVIGYKGRPRIVGIYEIIAGKISKIIYDRGEASLNASTNISSIVP